MSVKTGWKKRPATISYSSSLTKWACVRRNSFTPRSLPTPFPNSAISKQGGGGLTGNSGTVCGETSQLCWRCAEFHNTNLPRKLYPTSVPAAGWGCVIVSEPLIPLQECPPKGVTSPPSAAPTPHGLGRHHFLETIHLRPAINSLHFRAPAINPGTLN